MIVLILFFSIFFNFTLAVDHKNVATSKPFLTCFHHFGCINFTEKWFDSWYRPQNIPPLDYKFVNTKFLYLKAHPVNKVINYDPITANPKSVKITCFEKENQLILLIHDFTSNGFTGWIKHMALEIATMERYNIISVDWQEGAEPPFLQAISNARVVAKEIQNLIVSLEKHFNVVITNTHLIGHGVGAHIAGYVGKLMGGQIGRITGLDPTGPYFEGMPSVVHLDYTDAIYVEVIHTDGQGSYHQGTMQTFGNIDFYFNKGYSQPGCSCVRSPVHILSATRNQLKQGEAIPDCSHKRAFKYYIQAIKGNIKPTTSCSYLAVPLNSPDSAYSNCTLPTSNENNITCAGLGLTVDTSLYSTQNYTKLEVNTPSCNPFCVNRFELKVDFVKCSEAEPEGNGYFNLTVMNINGSRFNTTFNKNPKDSQVIILGKQLTFTVWTTNCPVDNPYQLKMMWHFTSPFCFECHNATCVDKVSLTHVTPYNNGADKRLVLDFCPKDGGHVVLYDHANCDAFERCNITAESDPCGS